MRPATFSLMNTNECIKAAQTVSVGRLSVVVDEFPRIYPVNFLIDDEFGAVFRVERDSTVASVTPTNACLEIDAFDSDTQEGWSVMAIGRLHDISEAIDNHAEHLRTLHVSPWATGEKAVWLSLVPHAWTGRALRHPTPKPRVGGSRRVSRPEPPPLE